MTAPAARARSPRRSLRIGFDLRRMRGTGTSRYARSIFTAVVAEAPEHEYVAVVQSEADAAEALAATPWVPYVVAPAAQFTAREMLAVPRLGRAIDLWHSPHPCQLSLGGRHRTVLTVLDLIPVTHAIGLRNLILREPFRAFLRASCRRAHMLVAISQFTSDVFHEVLGVPREKIRVAHLAPARVFAGPVDRHAVATARERWGLPRGRTVVYVGMSQPHKNLDRLLQALAELAIGRERLEPAPTLAVIGPNVRAERAALRARIHELRLEPHVRFLDSLRDEEVKLAYHAADVVVQPSLIEGFGLTLVEAMQCGTPVVASDIPVFREVVGDAALLVDPLRPAAIARGLRGVLVDPSLAATLRARGTARAGHYSWRRAALATLDAYDAAVA